MIFSYASTISVLLMLNVAEAGVQHLPIKRSDTGIYLLEANVLQKQGHQDQIVPRLPFSLRNDDTFFGSIAQSPRPRTSKLDDDDDDGILWIYFSLYTTSIGVGNPPLKLNATVDTSWSTSFVASVNCSYCCKTQPCYNSSLSSTYRADLTPVSVKYIGLTTEGKVSQDSIHVAGMEIKGQLFEEATTWDPSPDTRVDVIDSALGLSLFPARATNGPQNFTTPSPFQSMMQQKLLDKNIISLTFCRTGHEIGEMVLGGLPKNVTRKELIEVPLDHSKTDDSDHVWRYYTKNGWQVPVQSMSMTSNRTNASTPVLNIPQIAVVSSSFPWIGLPDNVADKIHAAIGIEYVWHRIDCDRRSQLPDWTIVFGPEGQTITLTPWDYLIEIHFKFEKKPRCTSAFLDLAQYGDKGFIILGAPFLNGLYSVFDADRKSISFGNRPL